MGTPLTPTIMRATPAHLDVLVPLFDGYRLFYGQMSDRVASRAFLWSRLAKDEAVVFLALDPVDQGRGWGFTLLYPLFSSIQLGRQWLLNDLFVDPAFRRRGVGRALMRQAHHFGRETGALGVELATAVDNIPGQRLYESLEYERDREFYHYYLSL